jgi:preprotein translocase subunit SecE
LSTQEKTAPKRRSSRGSTAKGGAARRSAPGVTDTNASGQVTAEAGKKTAATEAPVAAPAGRKVRVTKEQTPKKSLFATERFDGVKRMTRETYAEIKKVNWPDQQTTRNLTIVVIAVSVALGILLGGIDFVLLKIFEALP